MNVLWSVREVSQFEGVESQRSENSHCPGDEHRAQEPTHCDDFLKKGTLLMVA